MESLINDKEILNNLLEQIVSLSQHDTDFNIRTVLPAYCKERDLKDEYDGLFWGNEGATWKYRRNLEVVKLVDLYFVTYRKLYYPHLKHRNPSIHLGSDEWIRSDFPCRYDYLVYIRDHNEAEL